MTADDVAEEAATGKAYLHEHFDSDGRPVIVVEAAKHFPDVRTVYQAPPLVDVDRTLIFSKHGKKPKHTTKELLAPLVIVHRVLYPVVRSIWPSGIAFLRASYSLASQPARLTKSQQLCAYLIERAIEQLPPGEEQFHGIFNLHGFNPRNTDLKFVTFLVSFVVFGHLGCTVITHEDSFVLLFIICYNSYSGAF